MKPFFKLNSEQSNRLLDRVKSYKEIKSDSELATYLGTTQPVISKIRHGKLTVGTAYVVRILQKIDMPYSAISSWWE